jgi:hypothetical protein
VGLAMLLRNLSRVTGRPRVMRGWSATPKYSKPRFRVASAMVSSVSLPSDAVVCE